MFLSLSSCLVFLPTPNSAQLDGLMRFTTPDKILFGSDYPYLPQPWVVSNTEAVDAFLKEERGQGWEGLNRTNAIKLLGAEHFKSDSASL